MEKPYVSYTQHLPKAAWDKLGRGHRMIQAAGRRNLGSGREISCGYGKNKVWGEYKEETYMHELRELKKSDCRLKGGRWQDGETETGCKRNWAAVAILTAPEAPLGLSVAPAVTGDEDRYSNSNLGASVIGSSPSTRSLLENSRASH